MADQNEQRDRLMASVATGTAIADGWARLRAEWLHPIEDPAKILALRMAFFSGARHAMIVLSAAGTPPDGSRDDVTEALEALCSELLRFTGSIGADDLETKGTA